MERVSILHLNWLYLLLCPEGAGDGGGCRGWGDKVTESRLKWNVLVYLFGSLPTAETGGGEGGAIQRLCPPGYTERPRIGFGRSLN